MTTYGDYRSAREGAQVDGVWSYVGKIAYAIEHPVLRDEAVREWWGLADLGEVATAVLWCNKDGEGTDKDALSWLDAREWQLRLGDIILASDQTFEKKPLARKWSVDIIQEVLPIFKDWAQTHDPENVGITDEVFVVIESEDLERRRELYENLVGYAKRISPQSDSASRIVWAVATMGIMDIEGNSILMGVAFAESLSGDRTQTRETARRWSLRWTEHVLAALRAEKLKP